MAVASRCGLCTSYIARAATAGLTARLELTWESSLPATWFSNSSAYSRTRGTVAQLNELRDTTRAHMNVSGDPPATTIARMLLCLFWMPGRREGEMLRQASSASITALTSIEMLQPPEPECRRAAHKSRAYRLLAWRSQPYRSQSTMKRRGARQWYNTLSSSR